MLIVFLLCFGLTEYIPNGFCSAAVSLVNIVTHEIRLLLSTFHFQTALGSLECNPIRSWEIRLLKFQIKIRKLQMFDPTHPHLCHKFSCARIVMERNNYLYFLPHVAVAFEIELFSNAAPTTPPDCCVFQKG